MKWIKKNRFYILLGVGLVILFFVQYNKVAPVNWTPSFSRYDKVPYGNYVLYQRLADIFPETDVITLHNSPYQSMRETALDGNLLMINDLFAPDMPDLEVILDFVMRGNNLFLAAENISMKLIDTLGISIESDYNVAKKEYGLSIKNPDGTSSHYDHETSSFHYIKDYDSSKTKVLGHIKDSLVNFVEIQVGQGRVLLSTMPFLFSNYNILEENKHNYVSSALSNLEILPIIWDEYYKSRNVFVKVSNPLHVLFQSKPLRLAYYLLMVSLLFYIGFSIKRRQRIIPEIKKPANTSREFATTIGRLYFQRKNHKEILLKRISFILSTLRKRYLFSFNELDKQFVENLSHAGNINQTDVEDFVILVGKIKQSASMSDAALIENDKFLDEFENNLGIR